MEIKHIFASGLIAAASLFSGVSSATTIYTYNANSTIGTFVNQTLAGFAAEGYVIDPSQAQALYSSYSWSFAGDSVVGTSPMTNVSITATLNSPLASGGTVNLSLFASQLSSIDQFLDTNLPAVISVIANLPPDTSVFDVLTANFSLTPQQVALVNSASLTITLNGTPVPVPGGLLLLGAGLGALAISRKSNAAF